MADARIVGRFLAVVADTLADADESPDHVPLRGTITLTPSASAILAQGANPTTYVTTPVVASLDGEGYLSLNGTRGVSVLAPDAGLNPSSWTYRVTPALTLNGKLVPYGAWDIAVTAGGTVDLATAAPVPSATSAPFTRGIGVTSAANVAGSLVLTLSDGSTTAPVPLPKGDTGERGYAAPDSGMRRTPTAYTVPAGGTPVAIPNTDIPYSGSIFMSIDGNGPLPLWFQIYRSGAYNACKPISQPSDNAWNFGNTAEPTTGAWRIWVEGNGPGALLHLKHTGSYPRLVRFFWYDLYEGDGSMGGSNQGVTIRDIYATTVSLPTTGNIKGDAVLVNETGKLHVWSGTAWSTGADIRGPIGPAGPMGPEGPAGTGVVASPTNPNIAAGLWIQTGLGASGNDFTFWIEDGQ